MPGQLTRKAIAAQPEWLAQVPGLVGDRRLPADARVLFTGCGTSFHAALACGPAAQALELVEGNGSEADVLVAISTSGKSKNVLRAAEQARELGCKTIALTGATADPLGSLCDIVVAVPSTRTSRIQEGHITIGHLWCEMVDQIS